MIHVIVSLIFIKTYYLLIGQWYISHHRSGKTALLYHAGVKRNMREEMVQSLTEESKQVNSAYLYLASFSYFLQFSLIEKSGGMGGVTGTSQPTD